MSHLGRFSTQFFKKFFTFCKGVAGISFEFNCRAAIVKVHLLFRNSRTSRSPFELCAWKILLAGLSLSLSFPSLSAYYNENYASEISVGEEHRFHRLSFRCPSSDIPHISRNITSFPVFRFILIVVNFSRENSVFFIIK